MDIICLERDGHVFVVIIDNFCFERNVVDGGLYDDLVELFCILRWVQVE